MRMLAELVDVMVVLLSSSVKNSGKQGRSLLSGKKLTLCFFSKKARWRTQGATGQSALLQSLKKS